MLDAQLHQRPRIATGRTMLHAKSFDPALVLVVRHNRRRMAFLDQTAA